MLHGNNSHSLNSLCVDLTFSLGHAVHAKIELQGCKHVRHELGSDQGMPEVFAKSRHRIQTTSGIKVGLLM